MSKKDIWLDQAYLTYRPTKWATVTGGRIGNPFDSTDMLFSNDLNFDGVAAIFKHPLQGRDVTLFGTLGAFSTEYSANGWNSSSFKEGKSEDKWLLAAQAGAEWKVNNRNSCAARWPTTTSTISRASAPAPARRGTATRTATPTGRVRPSCRRATRCSCCATSWPIRPTRRHAAAAVRGPGVQFDLLDVNLRWDTRVFDGLGLRLNGTIRNLAYSKGKIWSRSQGHLVNNFSENGEVQSGPNAWMLQATLGRSFDLKEKGDWLAFVGYKYIQPDALPDGFNDSSFHQGGTNARGYYIGGSYAFDKNVYGVLRWMSTKEVYGAPLAIDTMQFEINARF